jgi:hypothetical protein
MTPLPIEVCPMADFCGNVWRLLRVVIEFGNG